MEFESRSYTQGSIFRPKALVFNRPESRLTAVLTPWGNPEVAEKVFSTFYNKFESLKDSGLAAKADLSRDGSIVARLVESINQTNSDLFQEENAKQLRLGVEGTFMVRSFNNLNWIRVGQPNLLVTSGNQILSITQEPDYSWFYECESPLPKNLIGIESSITASYGRFPTRRIENIVLISRSCLTRNIFSINKTDLRSISSALIEDNPKIPFWVGISPLD